MLEPALPAGSRLLAVVEAGSMYLDATVVSLEKAMGAGRAAHRTLDQRTALVGAQRAVEAYYYAGLTHPVLASINDACDEFATQLLAFDTPTFMSATADNLSEALDVVTLGRVLATNVEPSFLDISLLSPERAVRTAPPG